MDDLPEKNSGVFRVPIAKIVIGARQRQDLGDIQGLALDMQDRGQLQNIIVAKNPEEEGTYILIAGGRRLAAAQLLGWEDIDAKLLDTCDEVTRKEIELVENLKRKQYNLHEELQAMAELQKLKVGLFGAGLPGRLGGGWTQRDLARTLECSVGKVAQDLDLYKGMQEFPELAKEQNRREAMRKLRLLRAGKHAPRVKSEELKSKLEEQYLFGDFYVEAKSTEPGLANFVLTDVERRNKSDFVELLNRIIVAGGEGFIFCPIDLHTELKRFLVEAKFYVDPEPYILQIKTENTPQYFIWFGKYIKAPPDGVRRIYSFHRDSNVVSPKDKPEALATALLMLCRASSPFIIDPFGYGGVTAKAALKLGKSCRVWCDDKEVYERGKAKILNELLA